MSPPARDSRAAVPDNSQRELARAAATAAALIELALSDSQRPIATLGEALSRVGAAVAAGTPPAAADLDACVECLQFHDRMTQQLSYARDLLAAAAGSPDVVPGAAPASPSVHASKGSIELF